jgi:hypothetical protein
VLDGRPGSYQLRYMQTLTEIAGDKNSTIVFPLPVDMLKPLYESLQRGGKEQA